MHAEQFCRRASSVAVRCQALDIPAQSRSPLAPLLQHTQTDRDTRTLTQTQIHQHSPPKTDAYIIPAHCSLCRVCTPALERVRAEHTDSRTNCFGPPLTHMINDWLRAALFVYARPRSRRQSTRQKFHARITRIYKQHKPT